ncbi:MAG TPA: adenylate/guanylate cyclase domain-containing protein [Methylomirabilota bacterium]|nr:adenylate/guanylate cyclase domain-containing protein [Methylomirabilota bacterium]
MRTWLERFGARLPRPPANVAAEHHRFYVAATYGYLCGLLWHFVFIFLFWVIGARPLSLVNVGATLVWALVLGLHLSGKLRSAVVLAALEIVAHAALCVWLIGWGSGFHFYILAMAVVVFFAPLGRLGWNVLLAALNAAVFLGLHYFLVDVPPRIALTPWIVNALYYGNALSTFFVISLSAATYDRAATSAESALAAEKAKSEEMAELLRRMFGRYLSPEVMNSLIENPASLELGGEKRRVTIMMTDLRGFTAMSERLAPEQVVRVLNDYFEVMVEVIVRYRGTINEIIGDALLVFFGAPQDMPDRAQQAVACAIEMQNAMARVNERNRASGLPELRMGIGLNDAEVVVGNIGTTRRSKYAAVGSGVNMTSRIESYTVGGQILVSESVRQASGEALRVDGQLDVLPKGAEAPLRMYEVGGIAGRFHLALEEPPPVFVRLPKEVPVRYTLLEGKAAGPAAGEGHVSRLASHCLELEADGPLEAMANVRMTLAGAGEALAARDFYGKVIRAPDGRGTPAVVRLTSVPPEVDAFLEALRRYAATDA